MPKIVSPSHVDPKAVIADDVQVGPFCYIGPDVTLGAGCILHSHVVITGHTTIGHHNHFHPNCVIGNIPQDKKYRDTPTRLVIGNHNIFREASTVHIGTDKGGGYTRMGDNNMLMVNAHIGHDAQFGNNCILANNVMIAGHVVCGDNVNMMGGAGVHHFVTIGQYAYIGGAARIRHDVPPFVKVDADDQVRGLNTVGLRRAGFSPTDIEALEDACRQLFYAEVPFAKAMAAFDTLNGINPHVKTLVEFLRQRDLGKHGRYLEALRPK